MNEKSIIVNHFNILLYFMKVKWDPNAEFFQLGGGKNEKYNSLQKSEYFPQF